MTIYLDNLAATPIDPRIVERHAAVSSELKGNPHSVEHAAGQRAHSILNEARGSVGTFLGREPEEVLFTPGASFALWLAVQDAIERAQPGAVRVLASAVEHPALLKHLTDAERQGRAKVALFPVDRSGQPDLAALRRLCRGGVDLVCIMAANNETGTVTPVAQVIGIAREHGSRVLVDASQAAGRIDLGDAVVADQVVVSGAKMYGPRGAGVLVGLLTRRVRELASAVLGTPDVATAASMALACELRAREMAADEPRIAAMRDMLQAELIARIPRLIVNGDPQARLAGALHLSAPGMPGDAVVARLWGRVDLSTGAACQSGAPGPSHVLSAMRVGDAAADGAVRIGVGKFNDADEIRSAAALIAEAMGAARDRLRRCG